MGLLARLQETTVVLVGRNKRRSGRRSRLCRNGAGLVPAYRYISPELFAELARAKGATPTAFHNIAQGKQKRRSNAVKDFQTQKQGM
jgi:hypothetical protein